MSPLTGLFIFTLFSRAVRCGRLLDVIEKNEPNVSEQVGEFLRENASIIGNAYEIDEKHIIAAMEKENEVVAQMLINDYSDSYPEWKYGVRVVRTAIFYELESTLELLLTKKIDFPQQTDDGETCLHFAVLSERTRMLQLLLNRPEAKGVIDTDEGVGRERTPLHIAAGMKGPEGPAMVEALLKAEAPTLVHDSQDRLPLHYAAIYENVECAKILMKYEAEGYRSEDKFHSTPLYYALKSGVKELIILYEEYQRYMEEKNCEKICLWKVKEAEKRYVESMKDPKPNETGGGWKGKLAILSKLFPNT